MCKMIAKPYRQCCMNRVFFASPQSLTATPKGPQINQHHKETWLHCSPEGGIRETQKRNGKKALFDGCLLI